MFCLPVGVVAYGRSARYVLPAASAPAYAASSASASASAAAAAAAPSPPIVAHISQLSGQGIQYSRVYRDLESQARSRRYVASAAAPASSLASSPMDMNQKPSSGKRISLFVISIGLAAIVLLVLLARILRAQ